ncbi:hypothetical protein EGI26_18240 [Lacihabitans sp. CCS-44]|uniref:immunoglobulin domain-containing protein n=1 Tax=Lacihabitans sp. CCS-44 TaxID=2487331 RepID=UPI0020CB83C1|nr:3-coathanger stack domain-containing protein [Lacihabitans sp. CCS-44]MCP9757104.1 hypothetical protein [Lacihabitans sp. CCS-44]
MKTISTKNTLSIIAILCFVLYSEMSHAQWTANIHSNVWNLDFGTVKVTSSVGSVAGNNNYAGKLYYGADINADINIAATNGWIAQTINTTSAGNRFKATAGQPVTISLEFDFRSDTYNSFVLDRPAAYSGGGSYTNPLPGGIGKNEQANTYDANIGIPFIERIDGPPLNGDLYRYQGTYTFSGARSEAWLVFQFITFRGEVQERVTMVLPFIVDGVKVPTVPLLTNTSGQPRIITQPSLPVMVLHAPPGDQSYSRFTINKNSCQSVENSITTDLATTGFGSVKFGTKGTVGFIVEVEVEATIEFSASSTQGSSNVIRKNKETCISSTTGFGTTPGSREDIFVCEGLDFYYGVYDMLVINPTNYSTSVKKGLVMTPVDGSQRLNFLTRSGILNEIEAFRLDTLNTALSLKQRIIAKNQLNVWKQLIALNDANIANATVPTTPNFGLLSLSGGATFDNSTSVSTSVTNSIVVDNYIDGNFGVQGVLNVGGSGISAGVNFRSSKSYGATSSVTSSNTQTMSMHLEDDDIGDLLKINIYQDPMFGTPVFKLQNDSRTSCPFEGGYQRDQPSLQIVGSTQNTITIPDITLGSPAQFQIKVCNNNVTEQRTYNMGFVSQSNSSDLLITAAGSTGSQFGSFTVPANTCRVENYDVNISRRYPTSDVNFENLEFQLFPTCQPSIKSSVFANVSFAAPPLPTGVATNKTELCTGTPVILTANCAVTTTPTWYTQAVGGFPVAVGSSVTVNPSVNTTYYVGCETVNYVRDRVATKLVLVGNPSTVLNLTSNFTNSTFQIATTTLTASNKIFSPASVTYKAGNSLTFSPGFEAKAGTNFTAKIGGCLN